MPLCVEREKAILIVDNTINAPCLIIIITIYIMDKNVEQEGPKSNIYRARYIRLVRRMCFSVSI
jgi:hypothetical protein